MFINRIEVLPALRAGSWSPRQMGRQKEKPSEKPRQRTLEIIFGSTPTAPSAQIRTWMFNREKSPPGNINTRAIHRGIVACESKTHMSLLWFFGTRINHNILYWLIWFWLSQCDVLLPVLGIPLWFMDFCCRLTMDHAFLPRSIWTADSKFLQHPADLYSSVVVTRSIPAGTCFGPCVLQNTFYDTIAFIAQKSCDRKSKSYVFRVSSAVCLLDIWFCFLKNI